MALTEEQRKRMEENRKRRNKMKSQFGQFSSFSAVQLQKDGVIDGIKIGDQKMDDIKE